MCVAVDGDLVSKVLRAVQPEGHHFDIVEVIFFGEVDFCLGKGDRILVECGEVHPGSDRYAVDFFAGKGGSDSFFSIHKGAPFYIRNHGISHIIA